jgi:ABC-type transporter Mla subunit MlaD
MARRGSYLRVGLLLLAGLAVALGLVLWLAGSQLGRGKLYETYFNESVQGLNIGAPVKYRGVTVGQVTEMGLAAAQYGDFSLTYLRQPDYQLVFVRYRIDTSEMVKVPSTADAVQAGLRARLASQGLTGLTYVELDILRDAPPPLLIPWTPRGDYIPSVRSTISQVQDAAQLLAARLGKLDIEGLVNNLSGLAGDLRSDLRDGDVHKAATAATDLLTSLQDQIQRADLPGLSTALKQLAQGPQTQQLLASSAVAASRFATAAAELPKLIAALQATARHADNTSADLAAELGPILRDAQTVVGNLRDTTESLRRDPGQLLFGGPPPREKR